MITWKEVMHYCTAGSLLPDRKVEKTEEEWKALLTPAQFQITRLKGTEPAGSGALCKAHDAGKYTCVCCDALLFDSSIKYESFSGWPSFTQAVQDNAILYKKDESHGMIRVEVMCNVCESHLGHVFPDGPEPSGLRYCVNSASIKLIKQ